MRWLAVSDFFRNSNFIEAGLWCGIGAAILVLGTRLRIGVCGRVGMFVTLVAFGISDIVETRTGAWWDPWWLLVWKGVCVIVLITAVVRFVRARKKREHGANRAPS